MIDRCLVLLSHSKKVMGLILAVVLPVSAGFSLGLSGPPTIQNIHAM